MAEALGGGARLRNGSGSLETEVLRAGNAAVSQRHDAHGPHAQLRDRGRGGAREAHARIQRDAPDGMGRFRPAGGKRGDQK